MSAPIALILILLGSVGTISLTGCQSNRAASSTIVSSLNRTDSNPKKIGSDQRSEQSLPANSRLSGSKHQSIQLGAKRNQLQSANRPHASTQKSPPRSFDSLNQFESKQTDIAPAPSNAITSRNRSEGVTLAGFQSSHSRAGAIPSSITAQDRVKNTRPAESLVIVDDVVQSVFNHFPEVSIALNEIQAASGKTLSAQGAFDSLFSSYSLTQPLGFYKTQRFGVGVAQPLFNGGEVYSNYRIGDGNFEPWYGERETNEGGEFKAGFSLPMVKNRVIDQRRADLLQADINLQLVEADVDARFLILKRAATQAYWDSRIAAELVRIQLTLLRLAEARVDQIKKRVKAGDLARIAEIDNARFIAKRQNDLIKARRIFQKAAIKLSIFLRDASGEPYVIQESELPREFPDANLIEDTQLRRDLARAVSVRPELDVLRRAEESANVELELAQNSTLPKVDLKGMVGQDVGGLTSKKGDKAPLELQVGFLAEVPLQRREGLGKIETAQAKLGQIRAKLRLQADKIKLEIQDAASAINASFEQIIQSTRNLELTRNALELGKTAFENGDIDLIALNIYETSVAAAQLQLLDARKDFLFFKAVYDNAIRASVE